ncbi:hypothetical protein MMPV_000352 [Pyropia vietnamensis]
MGVVDASASRLRRWLRTASGSSGGSWSPAAAAVTGLLSRAVTPRWMARTAAAAVAAWVFVSTQPFPLYWAAWVATGGPAETPRNFTHGCAPRMGRAAGGGARLAYVVPLIPGQVPRLAATLPSWGDPATAPCAAAVVAAEATAVGVDPPTTVDAEVPTVDLVFFTDGPRWAPADQAAVVAALPAAARGCFRRLRFLGAGLSPDASVNRHTIYPLTGMVGTGGSNAQFREAVGVSALRGVGRQGVLAAGAATDAALGGDADVGAGENEAAMKAAAVAGAAAAVATVAGTKADVAAAVGVSSGALLAAAYDVAFYGEPDTWPLRPHWLPALQATADRLVRSGGWVVGSPMRYAPKFLAGWEPARSAYARHINGNALYRLGDPCFAAFLDAVADAYGDAAFDVAMNLYLSGLAAARFWQDTAWRFGYTDVVAHLSLTTFDDAASLRERLPDTYLVHGKARLVQPGQWGFLKY